LVLFSDNRTDPEKTEEKSTIQKTLEVGNILYFLRPEKKVHLGFFGIMSASILGNGTVILLLPRKIWLKYFPRFEK